LLRNKKFKLIQNLGLLGLFKYKFEFAAAPNSKKTTLNRSKRKKNRLVGPFSLVRRERN
jgi:hypothetical protein